jgi:hypothetical protein
MDFLDKNYLESSAIFWMKLVLVIHAITTIFLMCWSVIKDSMENYLLPLKSPHVGYLLITAYMIYVLKTAYNVKYLSSDTFVMIVWIIFIIASILLFILDALFLALRFGPTVADCYDNSTLLLPNECDEGDEKIIYTVTGVVAATHLIWTTLLMILSIIVYQDYIKYIESARIKKYDQKLQNLGKRDIYSFGNQYTTQTIETPTIFDDFDQ